MQTNHPINILARIKTTVASNYRFISQYKDREISDLIAYAQTLGADPQLIHDMICTGNRKGKFIPPPELKKQMRTYLRQIRTRAYPFCFTSKDSFLSFQQEVIALLRFHRLQAHDIRIHGSSLRSPAARDVDLIAILTKEHYLRFKQNHKQSGLDLNEGLKGLKDQYRLGGLDLLVVEDQTYFPNQPYLNFTFKL